MTFYDWLMKLARQTEPYRGEAKDFAHWVLAHRESLALFPRAATRLSEYQEWMGCKMKDTVVDGDDRHSLRCAWAEYAAARSGQNTDPLPGSLMNWFRELDIGDVTRLTEEASQSASQRDGYLEYAMSQFCANAAIRRAQRQAQDTHREL
ncbi:TPA: hypothetical protein L3686_003541 [Pseudomonas aeruginosa]|nr:hypothetical protein [Pseudomonas aeruginosa]